MIRTFTFILSHCFHFYFFHSLPFPFPYRFISRLLAVTSRANPLLWPKSRDKKLAWHPGFLFNPYIYWSVCLYKACHYPQTMIKTFTLIFPSLLIFISFIHFPFPFPFHFISRLPTVTSRQPLPMAEISREENRLNIRDFSSNLSLQQLKFPSFSWGWLA